MNQAWNVTAIFAATPDSALITEINGNESACSTLGTPSYCFEILPDLTTLTANTNVQTVHLTPTGNISSVPIPTSYLYPGFTGQIIMAYQPWFAPTTGAFTCFPYVAGGLITNPAHPCSGQNENLASVVAAQHNEMIAVGQGGTNSVVDVPDYYGNINGAGFLEATVAQEAADAASRCVGSVCPILFSVMIDKGYFTSGMAAVGGVNSAAPACAAATCTTAQIVALYEAALDHIDALWANHPYYAPSPQNSSHHELLTFLVETDFPLVNWTTVNSTVTSFMSKYAHPYDIFHWSGGFTEANQAGAYMWVKPLPYSNASPNSQYTLDNGNGYQAGFYTSAQGSGQTPIGGLSIGFDGSNNNYNQGLTSRECGQTIQFWSNALLNAVPTHYSSSFPIPAVIIPTWNDLGEGTNVEGGFDNCWRVNTPSYSGTTATWTLSATDSTAHGANVSTIHHFNLYFGDGTGPLYLIQSNITPATAGCSGSPILTCSYNLAGAAKPPFVNYTWNLYVKMVPQALGLTQMNSGGNGNGPPLSRFFPGTTPPPPPGTEIPVSSHLVDGAGNPANGAYLKFDLWNCGANFPIVIGQPWVVVKRSFTILANSAGVASGEVIPNDSISCGNVISTRWVVSTVLAGSNPLNASQRYNILSTIGTFDPSTAQPDTNNPPPPPGFSSLFGNPIASQAWRQPVNTKATFSGIFDFSTATLIGLSTPAVNINGQSVANVNLNSSTPSPDAGQTAATLKGSGSNYIIETPTPCSSNCTLGGTTTHTGPTQAQGEVFSYTAMDLVNAPLITDIPNCAGGTIVNKLAKLSSSAGAACALITTTSDTANIEGVVFATGGTSGNAGIAKNGQLGCIFDGATTANDFVINSTTVAGDCRDAGATAPTTSQNIGTVLSTNASAGLYSIRVASGSGTTSAGGSGNTTTSPSMSAGQIPVATGATAQKGSLFTDDGTNGAYGGTGTLTAGAGGLVLPGSGWPLVSPNAGSAVPQDLGGGAGLNATDVCRAGATCQGISNSGGQLDSSVIPDLSGTYVAQSSLGQPNGVPQLNASGQVIQSVVDGLTNLHLINCSSPATVLNSLVAMGSTIGINAPCAKLAVAGTTAKVLGVCIANCGSTGTATIQQLGFATCTFDGTQTARDFVQVSASADGDCTDVGSTYPVSGQVLGLATNFGGALYLSTASEAHGSAYPGAGVGVSTGIAWTTPAFSTNAKTATYTATLADFLSCKTIPVASGTFTITLVASGAQPPDGGCIDIINYGSGTVTVAASGQLINGSGSSQIIGAGSASAPLGLHIKSDGTNYQAQTWGSGSGGTVTASSTTTFSNKTLVGPSLANNVTIACVPQGTLSLVTGTATATSFFSCSIPANVLVTNTCIRARATWKHTGTTSVAYNWLYGAASMGSYSSAVNGAAGVFEDVLTICQTASNAQSFIQGPVSSGVSNPTGSHSTGTSTVTTTSSNTLAIQFNVAATDSVTPLLWFVEMLQ